MGMFDPRYPVYILFFRRYAPFARFGRFNPLTVGFGYFEGDDRGPSTNISATSRTYAAVFFNRFGPVYDYAGSSGTEFHPAIGSVIKGMAKVNLAVVRSTLAGPDLFGFEAHSEGGNPLVPKSPDIDTFVSARIDFGRPNKLVISGNVRGDSFPSLEVFVLDPAQRGALLVDGRATAGRSTGPMLHLMRSGVNNQLATFTVSLDLNQKGNFLHEFRAAPTDL